MMPSKPGFATSMNVFGEVKIDTKVYVHQVQIPGVRLLGFIHQGLCKGWKQNWMSTEELLLCFNKQQNTMYR